jgi:hypothetical protein
MSIKLIFLILDKFIQFYESSIPKMSLNNYIQSIYKYVIHHINTVNRTKYLSHIIIAFCVPYITLLKILMSLWMRHLSERTIIKCVQKMPFVFHIHKIDALKMFNCCSSWLIDLTYTKLPLTYTSWIRVLFFWDLSVFFSWTCDCTVLEEFKYFNSIFQNKMFNLVQQYLPPTREKCVLLLLIMILFSKL